MRKIGPDRKMNRLQDHVYVYVFLPEVIFSSSIFCNIFVNSSIRAAFLKNLLKSYESGDLYTERCVKEIEISIKAMKRSKRASLFVAFHFLLVTTFFLMSGQLFPTFIEFLTHCECSDGRLLNFQNSYVLRT